MQTHELDAWLGGTPATDEQVEALHRCHTILSARYPDADEAGDRAAAFSAAAQVILGDATVAGLVEVHNAARRVSLAAQVKMTGAVVAAIALGASEAGLATETGLARMTVRKALGKR